MYSLNQAVALLRPLPCCHAAHCCPKLATPTQDPPLSPHFTTLLLLLLPNPALLVPTCSYCAHSHGWLRCVTVHIDIVESTVGSKRLVLTRNLLESVLPVLTSPYCVQPSSLSHGFDSCLLSTDVAKGPVDPDAASFLRGLAKP